MRIRTGNFKSNDLPELEFIPGSNVSISGVEGAKEVQITISASGGGGGGGGITLVPTDVKSGNYTAAAGDFVPVDTTSSNVTVTLPTAPADGSVVGVKQVIRGGANIVTVAAAGSDVFNKTGGSTSLTVTLVNQGMLLQYKASGAIWYVVTDDLSLSTLDSRYTGIAATVGGDLTGTLPNPSLKLTGGGAAGPIGGATVAPVVSVDAQGRVTALTSATITGTAPGGSAGGDLAGSYPSPTLVNTGPGATGPVGSPTTTPVITIDGKGRVTALTSAAISGGGGGGSGLPPVLWTTLASGVSASAGSIDVTTTLPHQTQLLAKTTTAYYIVVGAFTTSAEIRQVHWTGAATSTHLLLAAGLTSAHSAGDVVIVVEGDVYAEWFGVVRTGSNTGSAVSGNAAALQNMLMQGATTGNPAMTYRLGPGFWGMDGTVVVTSGLQYECIDGDGGILYWPTNLGTGTYGLYINNNNDYHVRNLTMVGPTVSTIGTDPLTMAGLNFRDRTRLYNVNVSNFRYGIVVDFHDHVSIDECSSHDNWINVLFRGRSDGGDNRWTKFNLLSHKRAAVASETALSQQMGAVTWEDSHCGLGPVAFYKLKIAGCNFKRVSFEFTGNCIGLNCNVQGLRHTDCYYGTDFVGSNDPSLSKGGLFVWDDTAINPYPFQGIRGDTISMVGTFIDATPLALVLGSATVRTGDWDIDMAAGHGSLLGFGNTLISGSAFPFATGANFRGISWDSKLKMTSATGQENCTAVPLNGTAPTHHGTDGHATNGSATFTAATAAFVSETAIVLNGQTFPCTVVNGTTVTLAAVWGGSTSTTVVWNVGNMMRGDLVEVNTTQGVQQYQTVGTPAIGVMLESGTFSTNYTLCAIENVCIANVDPGNTVAAKKPLKPDLAHPGKVMQAATPTNTTQDWASIPANSTSVSVVVMSVPGAVVGEPVTVTSADGLEAGIIAQAWVSAANTVSIVLSNITTGAINPTSHVFTVAIPSQTIVGQSTVAHLDNAGTGNFGSTRTVQMKLEV